MSARKTSIAILAAACVSHSAAQEQAVVFRARVDIVSVPVAVLRGRNALTDITEREFILTDNGVRQVVTLDAATVPIDVTMVLCGFQDGQASGFIASLLDARAAVAALREGDRIRIIECGTGVREVVPMTDLGSIRSASQSARIETQDPVSPFRGVRVTKNNSLNDALFLALAWPAEPPHRHLVVVFSDGFDPWTSTLEAEVLPELAARSDAVIHAVMSASPSTLVPAERDQLPKTHLDHWFQSYQALLDVVRLSGGEVRFATGHLEEVKEALAMFRASYLLRYEPIGVVRGGWHDIEVTVSRGERLRVIARRGYFDYR